MKLIFSTILIFALSFFALAPAFGQANFANKMTHTTLYPIALITADELGSAVDVSAYEGQIAIIFQSQAIDSGKTLDVNIKHATTSGGSYSDVSGGAFTQVTDAAASSQVMFLNKSTLKRYIKLNIDVSSSLSGSGKAISASIVGFKKYRP